MKPARQLDVAGLALLFVAQAVLFHIIKHMVRVGNIVVCPICASLYICISVPNVWNWPSGLIRPASALLFVAWAGRQRRFRTLSVPPYICNARPIYIYIYIYIVYYNVCPIYIYIQYTTMRAPICAIIVLPLTFVTLVDICGTVVIATILVWFNYFTSKSWRVSSSRV